LNRCESNLIFLPTIQSHSVRIKCCLFFFFKGNSTVCFAGWCDRLPWPRGFVPDSGWSLSIQHRSEGPGAASQHGEQQSALPGRQGIWASQWRSG
jgi:hypothetical protein